MLLTTKSIHETTALLNVKNNSHRKKGCWLSCAMVLFSDYFGRFYDKWYLISQSVIKPSVPGDASARQHFQTDFQFHPNAPPPS